MQTALAISAMANDPKPRLDSDGTLHVEFNKEVPEKELEQSKPLGLKKQKDYASKGRQMGLPRTTLDLETFDYEALERGMLELCDRRGSATMPEGPVGGWHFA